MRFIITSILALYSILAFSQPADTVKIGLLVTDRNSKAAINGAELAIRKINEEGGYKGRPFQLIIRSMEGPWGTGSKEAVNLIFLEKVWAIMGSHDGRNAHLVEQVATKSRVVFLSAWASDPTLAQAFVPWYYTCVPTDIQQAEAIIEEINKRKISSVALIAGKGYDAELAMENFVKTAGSGRFKTTQLTYDNNDQVIDRIVVETSKANPGAIVFFGNPDPTLKIIRMLKERKSRAVLFGATSVLDGDRDIKSFEDVILVSPFSPSDKRASAFQKDYQKMYRTLPGLVSAYSYDGISILVDAIRNAGQEREKIQKYLSSVKFEGVTGQIQFDEKGKRIGTPELIQIKNGTPVVP